MDRATTDLKAIYSRRSAATDELHDWIWQVQIGRSRQPGASGGLRASDAGVIAAARALLTIAVQEPTIARSETGAIAGLQFDSVDRRRPVRFVVIRAE